MVPAEVLPSPQLIVAVKALAGSTPLAWVKVATWKLVSFWDFVRMAPETLIAGSANGGSRAVLLAVLESGLVLLTDVIAGAAVLDGLRRDRGGEGPIRGQRADGEGDHAAQRTSPPRAWRICS